MRLYLAGPMSGLPDHNYPAFQEAAAALRRAGFVVTSPAELSVEEFGSIEAAGRAPWAHHLRRDLAALVQCDGIALMDGWEKSKGAVLEQRTAAGLSMPIRVVEHWVAGDPRDDEGCLLRSWPDVGGMNAQPTAETAATALSGPPREVVVREEDTSTFDGPSSVVVVDPVTGAMKADGGKARLDLIPGGPLMEVGRVMEFGARKYAPNNWRKGFDWSRMQGAALRHLTAFGQGEDLDPETGLSHLAHALCCLLFLEQFRQTGTGADDRP